MRLLTLSKWVSRFSSAVLCVGCVGYLLLVLRRSAHSRQAKNAECVYMKPECRTLIFMKCRQASAASCVFGIRVLQCLWVLSGGNSDSYAGGFGPPSSTTPRPPSPSTENMYNFTCFVNAEISSCIRHQQAGSSSSNTSRRSCPCMIRHHRAEWSLSCSFGLRADSDTKSKNHNDKNNE